MNRPAGRSGSRFVPGGGGHRWGRNPAGIRTVLRVRRPLDARHPARRVLRKLGGEAHTQTPTRKNGQPRHPLGGGGVAFPFSLRQTIGQ